MSVSTVSAENRRSALRRQAALGTVCHLNVGAGPSDHLGLVWNLSASGVSMLLDEALSPASVHSAELATMDEKSTLAVKLRVVHVRKIRTGDYFLGAHFEQPLAADEMRPFLAEASSTNDS